MAEISEIFNDNEAKKIIDVSNAIVKADDALLKLIKDSEKLIQILQQQNISFDQLNNAQKQAAKTTKDIDNVGKQLLQSENKLKELEDERISTVIKNRLETQKKMQQLKEELKLQQSQENSIDRLNKRNKELRAEIRKLDLTQSDNIKIIQKYNQEIESNTEIIKENSDKITQSKINIGNYEESIRNALDGMNAFSGGATTVINNFIGMSQEEGGVKKFFTSFTVGIGQATKAGLKFIATPIGAVIFAIVAAISLFTGAIKRNQDASDGFSKIWSGIMNVIQEVIGRVFKLAGAIGKLLSGDWKGFKEDASQAVTGFGQSMTYAYNEGVKLQQLQIDLKKSAREYSTEIIKLNSELEKQQIIADDTTRSFAEREAAAEKVRKLNAESSSESLTQAQQRLNIANLELSQAERQGRVTDELRDKQREAFNEVLQLENDLLNTQLENEKTRRELRQDRLERDLDILIDGFDNIKTVNERIIADEKKTYSVRQNLLLETAKLGKQSFDQQISTIEQFTNKQVNANDLLAESDAIRLNQKIRELELSEIIEGRLLEIIRERRVAIQDLNEAQSGLLDIQIEAKDQSLDFAEIEKMMDDDFNEQLDNRREKYLEEVEIIEEIEERKREARMQTLDAIKYIFGEESRIGRLATAFQQAEAIKQNLISLGVITAKSAEGQAKSAAALPFPANIPLILGTIAQFVSITRLFAKSKVEGFWKGTENAPGNFIAGERGRELMMLKTGELMMVDKPTYFEGNKYKGATIKSNPETEKIIAKAQNSNNFVFDTKKIRDGLSRVEMAIIRKPVNITDKRGSIIGKQSGNYREIYINRLKNGR